MERALKNSDLYSGRDPRYLPAYSVGEAAHYLQLPAATLRSWVCGRYYPTRSGKRFFEPLIALPREGGKSGSPMRGLEGPSSTKPVLSFTNLVEAHVLAAVRKTYGVAMYKVRAAIDYLSKRYHSKHPLADHTLETDGLDIFVQEYGRLVNISSSGQLAMREVLNIYLKRIERDAEGLPLRFYPFTRRDEHRAGEPKFVVIDPYVSFGRAVLRGTGVPTSIIAERFFAGDSVEHLAKDYGRESTEIEEAIRCEREALAA